MQQIPLSQNQVALLDDEDFATLSQYRWCYRAERDGAQGYAMRHARVEGKFKPSYLHREVMNPPPGHEVIFLNHDRLDCRRENLRVVTKIQARRHHRARSDSRSGVKGITYNHEFGTWSANVYRHGHCYRVGTYHSKEAAIDAYNRAVKAWDGHNG